MKRSKRYAVTSVPLMMRTDLQSNAFFIGSVGGQDNRTGNGLWERSGLPGRGLAPEMGQD